MDDLRRQVRTLENDLSTLLTTYSKLAAQVSTTYSSSGILNKDVKGEYKSVEKELEEGLGKLASFVEQMQSLLNNSNPPASSSQVLTVQRHREIHQDYVRDFKRTQTSLKEAEARANLLGSVREEISHRLEKEVSDVEVLETFLGISFERSNKSSSKKRSRDTTPHKEESSEDPIKLNSSALNPGQGSKEEPIDLEQTPPPPQPLWKKPKHAKDEDMPLIKEIIVLD
ncbi:hypothetical protein BT69DRAFT_1332104 [Atractiella rhizophila]|nr:hypothetical protein BT69DRAFT_1332104 [Atractiella rhizophila]